jgi:hypothetical protein
MNLDEHEARELDDIIRQLGLMRRLPAREYGWFDVYQLAARLDGRRVNNK